MQFLLTFPRGGSTRARLATEVAVVRRWHLCGWTGRELQFGSNLNGWGGPYVSIRPEVVALSWSKLLQTRNLCTRHLRKLYRYSPRQQRVYLSTKESRSIPSPQHSTRNSSSSLRIETHSQPPPNSSRVFVASRDARHDEQYEQSHHTDQTVRPPWRPLAEIPPSSTRRPRRDTHGAFPSTMTIPLY